MKRLIYAIVAMCGLLLAAACSKETQAVVHVPAINASTIDPMPDESGTKKAYQGTVVTAEGFNLDMVSKVTVGDCTAEIVEQTIKKIVFTVPELEGLEQSDVPHLQTLKVYGENDTTAVFQTDYFITVPVTDALVSGYSPAQGTIGTEISVSGRNLEQVTGLSFNGVEVSGSDFIDRAADKIVFAAPAVSVSGARTDVSIRLFWSVGKAIDVTGETPFTLLAPAFAELSQTAASKIGDEITLNGENLDLVSEVRWGEYQLIITDKSDSTIIVKFPSQIQATDPAVKSDVLAATYGTPAQTVAISAGYQVDTTPVGPAKPVFTSARPSDSAYAAFFLGNEVMVTGENLSTIEKFSVDGIDAALSGAADDVTAKFLIPSTISGTALKEVEMIAYYNGGEVAFTQTISVYPFFYTKGLKIRIGSNSASSYPAANSEEAFLLLNEGRVISVASFTSDNVDSFALGTQSVIASAGMAAAGASAEQYYSVAPYYFAQANSSSKLVFNSPANSSSQLKTHRENGVSLPSNFGTPSIFAAVMTDAALIAAVGNGTLEDIAADQTLCGKAAPACGSDWKAGSVIKLQYVNFKHLSDGTGGKPLSMEDVCRQGYLLINEVTCADASGVALATREGYISFDLYWSNVITE